MGMKNQKEILVSICCVAYNHGPYIADAIEGFLMQKTDFAYEIIIGEDCSPDNTRQVIEEYQAKYPGKINMITSEHNVGGYENGVRILRAAKGKYIAFCEGDDYWIDPLKLQKQVDYMEQHPDCMLCSHEVYSLDDQNREKSLLEKKKIVNHISGEIGLNEFLMKMFPRSLPTVSKLYRRNLVIFPEWAERFSFGDLILDLAVLSKGYIYHMDEVMAVYRTNNPKSYCGETRTLPVIDRLKKELNVCDEILDVLLYFNIGTEYKWDKEIKECRQRMRDTHIRAHYLEIEMLEKGNVDIFIEIIKAKLRQYRPIVQTYQWIRKKFNF